MLFDMLVYRGWLDSYNISVIYNGPLWPDCVESIADTIRKRLEQDGAAEAAVQAVFTVFAEQMHCLRTFAAETEPPARGGRPGAPKGTFVFGAGADSYFIQCGGILRDRDEAALRAQTEITNPSKDLTFTPLDGGLSFYASFTAIPRDANAPAVKPAEKEQPKHIHALLP